MGRPKEESKCECTYIAMAMAGVVVVAAAVLYKYTYTATDAVISAPVQDREAPLRLAEDARLSVAF